MNIFLGRMFEGVKRKKGFLFFLILLSVTAIILGVIASVKFSGGVLVVDLSNIACVEFLKCECSFFSMFFKTILSLIVFMVLICLCGYKAFLMPLAILFYFYLIYSQTVVFISIILIYGFFNCVVFSLLHLIYILSVWFIFVMFIVEIYSMLGASKYFSCVFNFKNCNALLYVCCMVVLTLIFSIVLNILQSSILLLVY